MKTTLLSAAMVAAALLGASCATGSPYNRGSLSDAMDKARDDHRGSREVPNDRDEIPWWDAGTTDRGSGEAEAADDATGSGSAEDTSFAGPVKLLARGGNAWAAGPYFDPFLDAELLLGFRDGNVEGLLFAGLKGAEAKSGSDLADSIDGGVLFLRAGLEVRYYPFPKRRFLSPYTLVQIGGIYMTWAYRNPLDAGTETIFNDAVGGLLLAAGAGVSVVDAGGFRLGVSCIPELHIFSPETENGFQNDVFGYYGSVRWAIEAGIDIR